MIVQPLADNRVARSSDAIEPKATQVFALKRQEDCPSVDYLTKSFQDLSMKNRYKHRRQYVRQLAKINEKMLKSIHCGTKNIEKNKKINAVTEKINGKRKKKYKNENTKKMVNFVNMDDTTIQPQMFGKLLGDIKMDPEQFAALTEATDRLLNIGERFIDSPTGPTEIANTADRVMQRVGKAVAAGALDQLSCVLKSFIASSVEAYGEMILAVITVSIVVYCLIKGVSRVKLLFILTMLGMAWSWLSYDRAKVLVDRVLEYFKAPEGDDIITQFDLDQVVPQALDPGLVTDVTTGLLLCTLFPQLTGDRRNIAKTVTDAGRIVRDADSIVPFVGKVLQRIFDFICIKAGFDSLSVFRTNVARVDEWVSDTRKFVIEFGQHKMLHDNALVDRVVMLENKAYEILSQFRNDRSASGVFAVVRPLSNELSRIRVALQSEGVGLHKMRQAPVMVSLAGASQIGKTRELRPLVAALLMMVTDSEEERLRIKQDLDSEVWSYQPEMVYADGYHGQKVCFIDEKDLVPRALLSADNASAAMIRMGGVFAYPLHMAGVEQKGNVYFRSTIVIATTNIENSYDAAEGAVRFPEAVTNRFHFEVVVRVKEKYRMDEDATLPQSKWRLDKAKLSSDGRFVLDAHDYYILKRRRDPCVPDNINLVETGPISYIELLRLIAAKHNDLKREAATLIDDDRDAFILGERLRDDDMSVDDAFSFGEKLRQGFMAQMESPPLYRKGLVSLWRDIRRLVIGGNIEEAYDVFRNIEPDLEVESDVEEAYTELKVRGYADTDWFGHDYETSRYKILMDKVICRCDTDSLEIVFDMLEDPCVYSYGFLELLATRDHSVSKPLQKNTPSKTLDRILYATSRRMESLMGAWDGLKTSAADWASGALSKWLPDWVKVKHIINFSDGIQYIGLLWAAINVGKWVGALFGLRNDPNADKNSRSKQLVMESFRSDSVSLHPELLGDQIHTQMMDQGLGPIIDKVMKGNYYELVLPGETRKCGWGFFSNKTTFNICAHYLEFWNAWLEPDQCITLRDARGVTRDVPLSTFQTFFRKGGDWLVGELPTFRNHADLRGIMASAEELKTRKYGTAVVITGDFKGFVRNYAPYVAGETLSYNDKLGNSYKIPAYMQYAVATAVGDCGLPVFLVDPTTRSRKFVGFHVAGARDNGLCYVFPKEQQDEWCAQAAFLPQTMNAIGKLPRALGSSGVSSLRKSPLYEAWGPAKKTPAPLRPFFDGEKKIFPMEEALRRYDTPIINYDEDLVAACVHAAVASMVRDPAFREAPRKLTLQEALLGVDGVPYLDSVNRSTSPGYPWNMCPRDGYKGKERFFGNGPDISLSGPDWPELHRQIVEAEELLDRGERPLFVFADALKDELISHEKARIGKTRLFCPCPIVYYTLCKMYFGDFARKMMEARIRTESAVGINVYSEEWDMLARKLTVHGFTRLVAGDFKSFDASQAAIILRLIGDAIIQTFEDQEFSAKRRMLWMEVWNSRHAVHQTLYEWIQSLPSGHPLTVLINCLFVSVVMRMCYVAAHEYDVSSLRKFEDFIALIVYGDDNVLNVAEEKADIFNQHTITKHMATFGLTYTSEDKLADPPPFRTIFQVEFLKRRFRYEARIGRYIAPLRMETILEMPYWSRKNGYEMIWRTNLENALRELAFHEKHIFDEWCPVMVEQSRRRTGYVPYVIEYKALLLEASKMVKVYGAQGAQAQMAVPEASIYRNAPPTSPLVIDRAYEDQTYSGSQTSCATALLTRSRAIQPYYTRMRYIQYPGTPESGDEDQAIFSLRYKSAVNFDNNLMSTEMSQHNDMAGTTQILNEAPVRTSSRVALTDLPQGLLSATRVGYDQMGIKDFLMKPILLSTTNWSTQAAASVLINQSLPQDAFSQPLYAEKIKGFLGFRGTAVIRLQVNGNKFQAGRLLMVFIPQGNVAGSYPGMRLRSLMSATQLPRVELDLSTETEVVLEIPYISPTPFYNLATGDGPLGRVAVMVYSPLATGSGSPDADISMWINFKNVELVAPSVQMDSRRPKGARKQANVSEAELDAFGDRSISGGLTSLSRAAESFAQVPTLSSFAKPAGWALSALAGAASAFGYAKPSTEEATTKVISVSNFNMQNDNGVDMFPTMAMDASNKMSILPGYAGTDLDEMCINHVAQIPAYVGRWNWAGSASAGSFAFAYPVRPSIGTVYGTSGAWSTRDMTPLAFLGRLFHYWRGSIVLTLKIVKTTFHSGRLLIMYNPSGASVSINDSAYLLREIVDIRDSSEFRFVIPYTSTHQYLSTGNDATGGDTIGNVSVYVLNELVNPDTVASSVDVLIEVGAGPDFEFAFPSPIQMRPIILNGWAPQMDATIPSNKSSTRDDQNQGVVAIGSASIPQEDLTAAEHCMGEKVNSLLQLMKRYCPLQCQPFTTPVYSWLWRAFTNGAFVDTDATGLPNYPIGDYVSILAPCYAYSRGSVRVYAFGTLNRDTVDPKIVWTEYSDSGTILVDSSGNMTSTPGYCRNYQMKDQPIFGGTIVPYQPLHARLNRFSTSISYEPVDVYTSAVRVGFNATSRGEPGSLYLARAAGDNYSLGYFIGVPLVTVYGYF